MFVFESHYLTNTENDLEDVAFSENTQVIYARTSKNECQNIRLFRFSLLSLLGLETRPEVDSLIAHCFFEKYCF